MIIFLCALVIISQRRQLLFRIDTCHDDLGQQHHHIDARGQITQDGPRQRPAPAPAAAKAARLVGDCGAPKCEQRGQQHIQPRQRPVQGPARAGRAAGAGPDVEGSEASYRGRQPPGKVGGGEQRREREERWEGGQRGEVRNSGEERDEQQEEGERRVLGAVPGGETLNVGFLL